MVGICSECNFRIQLFGIIFKMQIGIPALPRTEIEKLKVKNEADKFCLKS